MDSANQGGKEEITSSLSTPMKKYFHEGNFI